VSLKERVNLKANQNQKASLKVNRKANLKVNQKVSRKERVNLKVNQKVNQKASLKEKVNQRARVNLNQNTVQVCLHLHLHLYQLGGHSKTLACLAVAVGLTSGVLLKMKVGIRKRAWQRD